MESSSRCNERGGNTRILDHIDNIMKFNKAQKRGIETCIDSILEGNGVCRTYLYEEGVKDGSRLMKMIHDI
ncbi:hypothetical protein QMP25_38440 [Enterocloster clostridioformis]